jgi:hypothetical protein
MRINTKQRNTKFYGFYSPLRSAKCVKVCKQWIEIRTGHKQVTQTDRRADRQWRHKRLLFHLQQGVSSKSKVSSHLVCEHPNTDSHMCIYFQSPPQIRYYQHIGHANVRDKRKVHPRRGHEGTEGEKRCSSTLSLTSALEGSRRSKSGPGRFNPAKETQSQSHRRLDEPQGWSGQVRKISPPPEFDPRTVQPVASRFKDWAIPMQSCLRWEVILKRKQGWETR